MIIKDGIDKVPIVVVFLIRYDQIHQRITNIFVTNLIRNRHLIAIALVSTRVGLGILAGFLGLLSLFGLGGLGFRSFRRLSFLILTIFDRLGLGRRSLFGIISINIFLRLSYRCRGLGGRIVGLRFSVKIRLIFCISYFSWIVIWHLPILLSKIKVGKLVADALQR